MAHKTKSTKRSGASKTHKAQRHTISVEGIKKRFKELDANVRAALKAGVASLPKIGGGSGSTLDKISKVVSKDWEKLFNKPLSKGAAKSLAEHYMRLYGKQKGGNLVGAPLDYIMRPGLPGVAAYATFPTEVGADPKAVHDMDVYYNSAIGRSCGTENTTAIPASNIGTNLVPTKGGSRRRNNRKTQKRKVGGDFMTSLDARQFVASNPSGPVMRMSEMWSGMPANLHDNADPSSHSWSYASGAAMVRPPAPASSSGDVSLASHPKIPGVSVAP